MPQHIIPHAKYGIVVGVPFDDVVVAQDAVGVETVLGDPAFDEGEHLLVGELGDFVGRGGGGFGGLRGGSRSRSRGDEKGDEEE